MIKRITTLCVLTLAVVALSAQTLNIKTGQTVYQIPAAQAGEMIYSGGETLTVMGKEIAVADIDEMFVDNTKVTDNTVNITYSGETAEILVAGNIAKNITTETRGAHVVVIQDADVTNEITYTLSGSSDNGSLYMDGQLKATFILNGVTLNNPDSAAINILDGKRINIELAKGTVNTFTDGKGGKQKGCFAVKGHTEFKGGGTLNITGNKNHAFWGDEYVEIKKSVGEINILGSKGDGFNVNQYFQMNGGTVTVTGVADDGVQVSYETDDDDNILEDEENTGLITIGGGTLDITVTGDGCKGLKTEGSVAISGGKINITQTGSLVEKKGDLVYPTSIKSDADITITGGEITINNTADGGKGISADGNITIDESKATVVIDIKANGIGGTKEVESGSDTETEGSYVVYVTVPTTGGGGGYGGPGGSSAWNTVYLYKSDGTLVQQLTATKTITSGYYSATFYYYDFKAADSGTYYFKANDYSGRQGTYAIQSGTFSGPTTGDDVYYSINNSYTTSGSTRIYSITNVTATYSGGTQDQSEESGLGYNAAGIKADGDLTINGGTITIENSGDMSKSIKSKATLTINGGNITLTPSGNVRVISNDASYSTGIKAVDFIFNDGTITINASGLASKGISTTNVTTNGGTLNITNSGNGTAISSSNYTAKGIKADNTIALNAGTINISMTGTGGKGIKSDGTYTQGTSDGNGPTLTVSTSGASFGSSSSGSWGGPGGGFNDNSGSSSKAIKVQGTITIYGGETTVTTQTDGAEGLESKTSIDILGGKHYYACYDDCINSAGKISFNGGVTVCYSNGNDAVDSNYGRTGAITIGDGVVFAYTSRGAPEEGLDCDNNNYIQITGNGIAISAGGNQGGGWGGGSSYTISGAAQGYAFVTSTLSYRTGTYYTLADGNGNPLVTYSFPTNISSTLELFTAKGMSSGSSYYIRSNSNAPTDATTAFHGLYLGSTTNVKNYTQFASFTAN
ncbi:MAG: carbohydrate-binding domain-containing protein [Prevotella sp.]|nr:carbohydrate-binding domain-containing protein [Prevotella sp.]